MKLYTIILNFRGGTYVSQVIANHINDAILEWAKKLDGVKHIGPLGKLELIELMREEDPVLLMGMKNVWCISGILKAGFFMANVVESSIVI